MKKEKSMEWNFTFAELQGYDTSAVHSARSRNEILHFYNFRTHFRGFVEYEYMETTHRSREVAETCDYQPFPPAFDVFEVHSRLDVRRASFPREICDDEADVT